MKKFLLIFFVVFLPLVSFCQDVKGYYILNNGTRKDGYFKQVNFYNEDLLSFRSNPSDAYIKVVPNDIKEYGAGDDIKFEKHTVSLDDTSLISADLGTVKEAEWVSRTVFLNVITEGDASLYSYSGDKGVKFFYQVKSKNIELSQLLYKKYLAKQLSIGENNQYRQQLYNHVSCTGQTPSNFAKTAYVKKELVKIFDNYNRCTGTVVSATAYAASASKKVSFRYTIFAGAASSVVKIERMVPAAGDIKATTLSFGVEAALVLPSEKFALFFRANYERFSSDIKTSLVTLSRNTVDTYYIDSDFFNFYLGPRYNIMAGTTGLLFIDASFAVSVPTGTFRQTHTTTTADGTVTGPPVEYSLRRAFFFNAGIGYDYKKKYGIEFRIDTQRDLSNEVFLQRIKLNRMGINLRYSF